MKDSDEAKLNQWFLALSYENDENCYNYKPAEAIRINMSYSEEDLHDEFLYMVHDLEQR